MTACFQHPDREAEVDLTFWADAAMLTYALCHNCRNATAIACLVHEGLIPRDYEIVEINEGVCE